MVRYFLPSPTGLVLILYITSILLLLKSILNFKCEQQQGWNLCQLLSQVWKLNIHVNVKSNGCPC